MVGGDQSAERWDGNQPKVTSQCQKEKQNEALGWMVASASLHKQQPLEPWLICTGTSVILFWRPDSDKAGSSKTKKSSAFLPTLSFCDADVYWPLIGSVGYLDSLID